MTVLSQYIEGLDALHTLSCLQGRQPSVYSRDARSLRHATPSRPATAIPPRTSRFWKDWSRFAAVPACMSAAPTSGRSHHLAAEVARQCDGRGGRRPRHAASRSELGADGWVTVRDNGRGIPVDPHPRFPGQIGARNHPDDAAFGRQVRRRARTRLRAGCTASASRWSMRCPTSSRSRWRATAGCGGSATAAACRRPRSRIAGRCRTGAARRCASIPTRRFSAMRGFRPALLYRMARSKAYLFRGVEIRWRCDPSRAASGRRAGQEARLHFPGGLGDFLAASLAGRDAADAAAVPRREGRFHRNGGSVEWAVVWPEDEDDAFCHSYCNTIPTPEGGTHEAGLRNALVRGIKAYGELVGNRRIAQATGDDVTAGAAMLLSLFMRDPQFQGQTKERLASAEATRLVESAVRDHFDHWLSADPATSRLLLDRIAERAEERQRRRQQKEMARKSATRKLRLPGKLADCTPRQRRRHRDLPRRGRQRRRLGEAGARPRDPGDPAAARQDPQRRQRLRRQDARQPGTLRHRAGARLRHRQPVPRGGAALRAGHHHDRRRCRRRAHRLAADDVLLPRDAEAGRQRPSVPGLAAALPADPGRRRRITRATTRTARNCCASAFNGRGKVEISRFKGLGEMPARYLKATTMDPAQRTLLRVKLPRTGRPGGDRDRRRGLRAHREPGRDADGPPPRTALRLHPEKRPLRPRPRRVKPADLLPLRPWVGVRWGSAPRSEQRPDPPHPPGAPAPAPPSPP